MGAVHDTPRILARAFSATWRSARRKQEYHIQAISDWLNPLRIWILTTLALVLLAGGPILADDGGENEARALLEAAVAQLQAADSFKLAIAQTGEPYPLAISLDGFNSLPASLISADAHFIQPGELYISVNVRLFLSVWLNVYALAEKQWLSFPSGAPWRLLPPFEGFDVNRLMAADDGIQLVIDGLLAPRIIDDPALIDDEMYWRLQGLAEPAGISALLFGFIEPQDHVELVAYIHAEDGRLASLELTMLETAGIEGVEATVWLLEFYDYDGERDFEPPSG